MDLPSTLQITPPHKDKVQLLATDTSLLNFTKREFGLFQWKDKGSKEHSLHH